MAIKKKDQTKKITIDISGPEGNAFYLIGTANKLCRQLSFSKEKSDEIIAEMMSSDYENLVESFDRHFGDYVDLER